MGRRAQCVIGIALGALLLTAATGCSHGPERTILVGDSLIVQSSPVAKKLLAGKGPVKVVATPGVRIGQVQREVERVVAKDPPAIVVLLGANNINQGGWGPDDVEELERMLAVLGKAPCVRWVNASTTTDRPDYNDGAAAFNKELESEVKRRYPHVRVVEWAGRLAASTGWILPNDIHLTDAGRIAMGQVVANAAKECLSR